VSGVAAALVVRHGATEWSVEKRLQGRKDIPLSEAGRQQVECWQLPLEWRRAVCLTSPLARAQETAQLLGFSNAQIDDRLIETDWGEFEGERLDCLRREFAAEMAANERRGIDFRPPGGESPREAAARALALYEALARRGGRFVLVTHKGVRNASIVLATGWDMTCKPPIRLRDSEAIVLDLSHDGMPAVSAIVSLA